ncbi:hypothetical protein HanPSC8_Chr13g0560141 [Helianthus annuus]|nr:hypothetical protein HanPSC8_Chr13g0560141 [Helianthus annuus]
MQARSCFIPKSFIIIQNTYLHRFQNTLFIKRTSYSTIHFHSNHIHEILNHVFTVLLHEFPNLTKCYLSI